MSRLVLTTPLKPTESLPGYLLRLTQLNGYDTNSYLLGEFTKTKGRACVELASAHPLIALAGVTPAEATRLSYQIKGRTSQGLLSLLGQEIVTCDYRLNTPRVCPSCIEETGVCEAFWDLAMATACPVHKIALLDRCEVCSKALRWGRSKIDECRCGANLAIQGSRSKVSQCTVDLMQAFRWALYQNSKAFPLPSSLKHIEGLNLYSLCKLVWVLSSEIERSVGDTRVLKTRNLYISYVDDAAELLANWPENFQSYLNRSYGQYLNDAKQIPRFATTFGWALVRMHKNLRDNAKGTQFLVDQIYRFGAEHWSRDMLLRRGEKTKVLPKKMKWGTIKDASAITGLQIQTLSKRIAAGEIPIRRIEGDKKTKNILVDLEWARGRKRSRHAPVYVNDAAKALGLTIEMTKELRKLGVFQVTHHLYFPTSYSVEDIKILKTRFIRISGPRIKVVPTTAMKLSTALKFRITDPKRKAYFLKQLLDGKVPVLGNTGVAPMEIVVGCSDVDEFIKHNSGGEADSLTKEDTANRLNASHFVVQALVDKGYLKSHRKNSRDLVFIDSLIAFQERYTMLSQVAKRAGLPTGTILSLAKKMKLKLLPLATKYQTGWMVPQGDLSRLDKYLA